MPQGRPKSNIAIWAYGSPAAVPSQDPPVGPALLLTALPSTTRPALQNVSSNKRRFNTIQDAAVAERFLARRQGPSLRPNKRFREA
jgi:hypothetical protein